MIKAAESSGSKGVFKLENEADYRYWSAKLKDYVLTEFIEGTEYTVDCLFDRSGRLVVYNNRERIKTSGGAVVVAKQAEATAPLLSVLEKIESRLAVVGPVNFQYILDRQHRLFLIDFNTRFASGGLPLTIAEGCDIPNLMIRLMLNEPVQVPRQVNRKLTMYRYYEECFAEEM